MAVAIGGEILSLWRLFTCLLMLVNVLHSSVADMDVSVLCSGRFWCAHNRSVPVSDETEPTVARPYFQYSPKSGVCLEVEQSGCVPATNCTFSSAEECYSVCGDGKKSVETCGGTEYGCCGDGVTVRQGDGGCPEAAPNGGDKKGRAGVHWGVITSGVCGVVLLLGVVAVVGLSTYAYRQRNRKRHRWYIHEVLQMYDAGESSDSGAASDSSWDDPEHKNLFDRL